MTPILIAALVLSLFWVAVERRDRMQAERDAAHWYRLLMRNIANVEEQP